MKSLLRRLDKLKDAEYRISDGGGVVVGRSQLDLNLPLLDRKPARELLYIPGKGKSAQPGFE